MSSVKESLHKMIKLLSGEEAHQILEFIQHILQNDKKDPLFS